MPRKKKALQAATVTDRRVLEPDPPADLWQQLDAINQRNRMYSAIARPPKSFTAAEYADRFGISASTAKQRLKRLTVKDEVEVVAAGINNVFYYRLK